MNYRMPGPLSDVDLSDDSYRQWRQHLEEERTKWRADYDKAREEYVRRCRPVPLGCYSIDDDPILERVDEDQLKTEPEYRVLCGRGFCHKGLNPGTSRIVTDAQGINKPFRGLYDYIMYRNWFFGSAESYWEFAQKSDAEFDANKNALTKLLPNPYVRRGLSDAYSEFWYYYFYRWLRQAYIVDGKRESQVLATITGGIDPKLKARLNLLRIHYKLAHGRSAGLKDPHRVPRPMKTPFRLGTVSDHAYGRAIDIQADRNPDLPARTWRKLELYAGKTVDRSTKRWWSHPKGLWTDIHDLNETVVRKMQRGEADAWAAAQAAAAGGKTPPSEDKVKSAFRKKEAERWGIAPKLFDGFFTLKWELVELLHHHGFRWGATFDHADLHHFQ